MTCAEQQTVDREAPVRLGITLHDLMLRAGRAVADAARPFLDNGTASAVVLAGPGNNGGDAYTAARLLREGGYGVSVVEAAPDRNRSELAAQECDAARAAGVPFLNADAAWPDRPLILDGVFGAGFSPDRTPDDALLSLLRRVARVRREGGPVLSIDMPTGVASDTGAALPDAVRADVTVTMVRPKPGLFLYPGRMHAGRVTVAGLGVPESMTSDILSDRPVTESLDRAALADLCPRRPSDGHKNTFGRVLVAGGSPGMTGAAVLAALGAARSGAGLVTAMVPEATASVIRQRLPEALTAPWEQPDRAGPAQAVAAGPGLHPDGTAAALLVGLLDRPVPLVLDAGALTCIARDRTRFVPLLRHRHEAGHPTVLTPHPGEFSRLCPDADLTDRLSAARQLATSMYCTVVLKGAGTVVADPDGSASVNLTGNDGMATAGAGDVLCGLIAGLAAQGMTVPDAARAGVALHGLAGDIAARHPGRRAMTAGDLADMLGPAFREAGWEDVHD